MGRLFLRAGAWWGLRILTGTENLITCCSMRAPVKQRSFICLEPPASAARLGQLLLRAGAWWGLRILTGTENLITCCSMRAPVKQ